MILRNFQRKQWFLIGATWLLGFVMWGTLLAVTPVLTVIGQELGLVYSELGLVFSIPILMLAIFALPGGVLVDRIGPRKIGTIGSLLIGVGGLLRGMSTDFLSLMVFSAVFGVGLGLSFPALPKIIGGWFERNVRGTATGIFTVGIYFGAGIATAFALSGSWRGTLVSWGIISMLVAIAWWLMVRDPAKATVVKRTSSRRIFTNKQIWILTAVFFLGAHMTLYTFAGWLPSLIALRAPAVTAAFVASLLPFFAAPAALFIPVLSDKFRRRKPFLWIPAVAGAGATYVVFSATVPLQATAVAVLGISIGAIFVICITLPTELVSEDLVGSATGLLLLGYFGGVIGPWFAGFTQDLTSSFTPTMIMLIATFVATAALALSLPETGKKILPST